MKTPATRFEGLGLWQKARQLLEEISKLREAYSLAILTSVCLAEF